MGKVVSVVAGTIIGALVVGGVTGQIYAMSQCGLSQSLIFGKNLFWAWYFGYCG